MSDTFSCPTCGAPLTYQAGDCEIIPCPYCHNSVILPAELRNARPEKISHDQLQGELLLPQIRALLARNQKIEAIKLVRQNIAIGLKEAKDAVDEIEAGTRNSLADLARPAVAAAQTSAGVTIDLPTQPSSSRRACSVWIAVIGCFIFLLVGVVLVGVFMRPAPPARPAILPSTKVPSPSPVPTLTATPQFASEVFSFGSEGIGAGKFTQANSLAIDPDGYLYVGDYKGNRVQVFDPSGKFIVQWNLDPSLHLHRLVAGLKGELYVNMGGRLFRYDRKTGQPIGEVQYKDPTDGDIDDFGNMAVGLDDSLWITWINNSLETDALFRFDPTGKLIQTIDNPIKELTGEFEYSIFLALDGLGNIYALGQYNNTVCEYSPLGKLITRFGSLGNKPGQFDSPQYIAVDSRGRIFVAEFNKVHVFDSGGLYLDSFDVKGGAYVMAFNRQDNLFLLNNTRVAKYVFREK
jgi:outer membrane protein assembly factor BamB